MATPTFARSLRKSPVSCNAIVSTGETLVFNLVRLGCFSSYSFYVFLPLLLPFMQFVFPPTTYLLPTNFLYDISSKWRNAFASLWLWIIQLNLIYATYIRGSESTSRLHFRHSSFLQQDVLSEGFVTFKCPNYSSGHCQLKTKKSSLTWDWVEPKVRCAGSTTKLSWAAQPPIRSLSSLPALYLFFSSHILKGNNKI